MNPTFNMFMKFIREAGCSREIDMEFERQNPGYHLDENLWDILGGDEFIFGRVFDWEQTLQGREFWAKIDQNWYELVINKTI